jgi:ADP-ribose pyrophosphatase YjhB (NUDIX family)
MSIAYCLHCGQALTRHDDTCYECPAGHQYFNNPRTGASVIFMQDGNFLAVRRGIEPKKDTYSFVGGFLQYGENPETAARREAQEETGVQVGELKLLDVSVQEYTEDETTCSIIYLALDWKGSFEAGDDAGSLEWKPLAAIDSDDFAWPHPGLLAKLKAIADNT